MKHALTGFAKSLRDEVKDSGVGVSLLCPSGVVGNLATTSALSRSQHLNVSFDDSQGKQPANRVLVESDVIGSLVIEAIKESKFLISNKPAETLKALESEQVLLKKDLLSCLHDELRPKQ